MEKKHTHTPIKSATALSEGEPVEIYRGAAPNRHTKGQHTEQR